MVSQQFPEIVRRPAAGPLLSGQTADEYVGRYAARLRGAAPGGRDAFVASSVPLRDPDGSGRLAPVDVTLAAQGAGWAPKNPLEPYAIDGDGTVRFTEGDLAVEPAGQDVSGQLLDEVVFFADTQTDTDTLVKPRTDGVQFAWQLRSASSPEALELHVRLPDGASLAEADAAGVEIVEDGMTVGRISPAIAYDADGTPVDADLEVAGDRVQVRVAHRGEDLAYPIMVDPEVTAAFYFNYQGHDAFNYWGRYNQPGNKMVTLAGDHWYGRGLYVQSASYPQEPTPLAFQSNGGPGLADRAGYYYHAPGDARIYKVTNALSRHILGAALHQCMIVGIANADLNVWEGPYGQTYGEGCAPFASYAWTVQVPNGGGTLGNAFLYGVYTYSNNSTAFNSVFSDAQIYMYDFDAPTGPPGFAGPQVMAPKTPPDWMTNADDPISATARDRSTGVKSITFYGPASWTYNGMNGQTGITITNPNCAYGPCDRPSGQQYQSFTAYVPIGNMPDGQHTITAIARDAAGNLSSMSSPYSLRFDSTPPEPVTDYWIDVAEDDSGAIVGWATTPDVQSGIASYKTRWRAAGGTWTSWVTTTDDSIHIPGAVAGEGYDVEVITVDAVRNESATSAATLTVPDLETKYESLGLPDVEPDDHGYQVEAVPEGAAGDGGGENGASAVTYRLTQLNPNKDCRLFKDLGAHKFGMQTTKTPAVTWGWFLKPVTRGALLALSPSWSVQWTGKTWVDGHDIGQPAPHPPTPGGSLWLAYTFHSSIKKLPNDQRLHWGDVIHFRGDMRATSTRDRVHAYVDVWCTVKR